MTASALPPVEEVKIFVRLWRPPTSFKKSVWSLGSHRGSTAISLRRLRAHCLTKNSPAEVAFVVGPMSQL